jgi:hypothetical protein
MIRARHKFATLTLYADDESGPDVVPAPINVTAIYQSTADLGVAYNAVAGTILTVVLETALPADGQPGAVFLSDWVHVDGLVDNRLNYPNLAIKYISPDRKTITAGFSDESALPSLAATYTPSLGTCKLHLYNNMVGAHDGAGFRFTGTTATSAALVSIFGGGDVQVSGTLLGDHRVTVSTTAPVVTAGAVAGNGEIKASSRYRIETRANDVAFLGKAVDANVGWTHFATRTAVKPAHQQPLRSRFRLVTAPSATRPVAKVLNIVKTSGVWTVTHDGIYTFATGQYVTVKGNRNQTDYANFATPVAITVVNSTSFTLTGSAGTAAAGFGGSVILANGGVDQPNVIAQSVQSATLDATTGWLTLVGSAAWAGVSFGDYAELHGLRVDATGADLGVDGCWEVANVATTSLVLMPVFNIGAQRVSPAPAPFASTNCGGSVILRVTLRAHDMILESYNEQRVVVDGAGTARLDKAIPMRLVANDAGATSQNVAVTGAPTVVGSAAEDAAASSSPVVVGGVVRTAAAPATLVAGDAARDTMTAAGAKTSAIGAPVVSAEVASAARVATGNSGTISVPTGGGISGLLVVSAVSGATPTLDLTLEESFDAGTNWLTAWSAPRVTGVTSVPIPQMAVGGLRRWVWTIGGGTPSFTFAINTNQLAFVPPIVRKLFDRTAGVLNGTATTPTAALNVAGCKQIAAKISVGAITTTPGTYQIQVSDDNAAWSGVGTPTAVAANTTLTLVAPAGVTADWARVIVTGAATGQTGNYVAIQATS